MHTKHCRKSGYLQIGRYLASTKIRKYEVSKSTPHSSSLPLHLLSCHTIHIHIHPHPHPHPYAATTCCIVSATSASSHPPSFLFNSAHHIRFAPSFHAFIIVIAIPARLPPWRLPGISLASTILACLFTTVDRPQSRRKLIN